MSRRRYQATRPMPAGAREVEIRRVLVKDIMHGDVISVQDDMTVRQVASLLTEHQISGAPVEDAEGRVIGVISYADIARFTAEPGFEEERAEAELFTRGWEEALSSEEVQRLRVDVSELTARDLMTPRIFSVPEDAPVSDAARLMLEAHIHRLLVTSGRKVVGILAVSDLLALLVEAS